MTDAAVPLPAPHPWSLSRLRLGVQIVLLGVTVYGGLVTGPYMADKLANALPALSCAFDQQNGGYCALIPFQHQFHHQLGEGLARTGSLAWATLWPVLVTLMIFLAFFIFLNKAFCGWVCPLGTVQELLGKAGRRLHLRLRYLPPGWVGRVRLVKWLLLLFLVFALPLAAGLGLAPQAAGDAWCRICPSRIVTTLLTGNPEQLALAIGSPLEVILGILGNLLAGFVLMAAFVVRQPFCRICPMLALHALFRRLPPLRLAKQRHPRCGRCHSCHAACPMEIREISTADGPAAFHDDCTLCGRCIEYCPEENVLSLRLGPLTLYRSSRALFQTRTGCESPAGFPKKRPMPTISATPATPTIPTTPIIPTPGTATERTGHG
ncbi:MAG: 4Fe-4S binding protein [Magnetococcales bacterium]|nr:4Fe-4S binding protein [Magnetococcales bacterium]